ncbi:hypothetical protein BZL29_4925 [Mycobacterium kansasii]|uniref:Uncharacterized protein n=1 Tax=Mycobacterium kansasii TaxID=1768 RepID=A0A1V3X0S8_MYCKA|nr:hypothetical protein BZL29_4925 [Mycobacterium kansasii]
MEVATAESPPSAVTMAIRAIRAAPDKTVPTVRTANPAD